MRDDASNGDAPARLLNLPEPPAIEIGRACHTLQQTAQARLEVDTNLAGDLRRLSQRAVTAGFRLRLVKQTAVVDADGHLLCQGAHELDEVRVEAIRKGTGAGYHAIPVAWRQHGSYHKRFYVQAVQARSESRRVGEIFVEVRNTRT